MRSLLLPLALLPAPALAQGEDDLARGFAGALRGCELWVLEPKSWSGSTQAFVTAVGLGDRMGLVEGVPDIALPPPGLRAGNLFWRINSTLTAGYFLVVSFQQPMCHITGGGDTDLKPMIEAVLAAPDFALRWEKMEEGARDEMISTIFRNRAEPRFSITVSRADAAGERLDRVQVQATALLALEGKAAD